MKVNAYDYEELMSNDDEEVKKRMDFAQDIYRRYIYGQMTKEEMDQALQPEREQ